ncbi:bifunctional DedA family/phosphatase PAP2 family protein [Endozoicomonas sp. Mp262]|uniref:bifunctional DedA family/phosphatase PAP2 family protein n=1 Tax=Endozoicomonas sp. Mp262 TaxID=2919499 RepID=UPI0021DA4F0F
MYLPSFEVIQSWLQLNSDWLGPAIAFMALVESLVIVGLLVPGVPIMFALGAMAGAGALDPLSMLIWGVVGAAVGDGISFQLGYHYHQRVRYWWPFNKHPEWLTKGEIFFHNHGDLSIALGRFIGPVRPVVPVVAGMLDMPPKRFYIVNILSAIPWAPVYLMPGYLAGTAVQMHGAVPVEFFSLIMALVVAAIVIPTLVMWLKSRFISAGKLYGWLGVLSLGVLLVLLVMECTGLLQPLNSCVGVWIDSIRMPYLQESMVWLTWLGSLKVLWLPVLVWVIWNLNQSRHKMVILWLLSFLIMECVLWSLKWGVGSPRPSVANHLDPFSFPSAHTAQATFVLLWLGIQLSKSLAHVPKVLVLSTSLMLVFLTGLSRLVLNVHWVGDVAAGFLLGLAGLFVVCYLDSRRVFKS